MWARVWAWPLTGLAIVGKPYNLPESVASSKKMRNKIPSSHSSCSFLYQGD